MDFTDRRVRVFVSRAIGEELRRAREAQDWSRAQFVERLPSGIGERTLLSMHQWARNKLNRHPDGVTTLAPTAVKELADFIGCARDELASHLARFIPDAEYE